MSHFASGDWNNPSGLVFSLNVPAQATATLAAVAVPGVSYTTVRQGLYRVTMNMRVPTADGGASAAMAFTVAFTDIAGNAKTVALLASTLIGTNNAAVSASVVIKAKSATAITVTETSGGAISANGVLDLDFLVEAL